MGDSMVGQYFNKQFVFIKQIDGTTGETVSFVKFFEDVRKVHNSLWKLGMRKGDIVVIYSPNNIYTPILIHATASLGGIVSPCNALHTAGKILLQLGLMF